MKQVYFVEKQKEVLDQYSRRKISAFRKEGLSVYQWSVKKKVDGDIAL